MTILWTIVGESGAGKSKIGEWLEKEFGIPKIVTHTTRPIRTYANEQNGTSYHFVTQSEFEDIVKVESAEYAGHWYGISREEIEQKLAKGEAYVICEPKGWKALMNSEYAPFIRTLVIEASASRREQWMAERGDSSIQIQRRRQSVFDNPTMRPEGSQVHVIVNDGTLAELYEKVAKYVCSDKT